MLGRKTSIKSNDEWLEARKKSTEVYTRAEVDKRANEVIDRIREVAKGYNSIYSGYVAGKDSLVLDHILKQTDIDYTPVMWRGVNEWPDMEKWILVNAPRNLKCFKVDKFSFEFLNKHPEYLFCQNGTRSKWMAEKWACMKKDLGNLKCDLFITGRRIRDGNRCGENGLVKGDYDTYSPLFDWPHELLLAYIEYNDIALPPFYSYPRGYLVGSIAMGEWTEYACLDLTEEQVWDEIYNIDKRIIKMASKELVSARQYLERRGEL